MVATREDVAAFFGVVGRTAGRWLKSGAPGRGSAGYDLAALARWLAAGRSAGGGLDEQRRQADTLLKIRRAERESIEVDRLKGRYVERAKADADQQRLALTFIGFIDRLPRELDLALDQVPKRRRRDTIQRALDEARIRLVGEIEGGPLPDDNGPGPDPAPDPAPSSSSPRPAGKPRRPSGRRRTATPGRQG